MGWQERPVREACTLKHSMCLMVKKAPDGAGERAQWVKRLAMGEPDDPGSGLGTHTKLYNSTHLLWRTQPPNSRYTQNEQKKNPQKSPYSI